MPNNNIDKDMKEEILKEEVDKINGHEQPHYYEDIYDGYATAIYNGMGRYAELLSIEFTDWVSSNGWNFLHWGADKQSGWHKYRAYNVPAITTQELFQLFIQSKASKNGK